MGQILTNSEYGLRLTDFDFKYWPMFRFFVARTGEVAKQLRQTTIDPSSEQ